jgi:RHS repeat-associated protein
LTSNYCCRNKRSALFNGKELDEENGMYYYSARYYAPPTFISRDPLFEAKPWMSCYAYCRNNPLKYIDPDGRDEWEVDNAGKYKLVKACEGNDVINSTRRGVKSQTLSGNGVLQAAFNESTDKNGNVTEQSFSGLSRDDAQKTFTIAGASSSNEWGYMETQNADGSISTMTGTNFDPNGEGFIYNKALNAKAGSLLRYDHSHPCTDNAFNSWMPSRPGTGFSTQYNDIAAWKALLNRHPNASMGIFVKPIMQFEDYQLHVENGKPKTSIAKKYW